MLKKYFVLCGIEQSFSKLLCFSLQRIQNEFQTNDRFSKKGTKTMFLVQRHTTMQNFFIYLHNKNLFRLFLPDVQPTVRKYMDLSVYCLVENRITWWALGDGQIVIMILFGVIHQTIENPV